MPVNTMHGTWTTSPADSARRRGLKLHGVWWRASLFGAAVTMGLLGQPVSAQMSGTLLAQIQLTSGCIIAGSTGVTTGVDFGLMDFGTHPSTFIGTAAASATGGEGIAGPTQLVCSPDVLGINIEVGPGAYAGLGNTMGPGARAMRHGSIAQYVPYDVYQDPAHLSPYPLAAPVGIPVPANGAAFDLPIYGLASKTNPVALPPGVYSDTLQITVTY